MEEELEVKESVNIQVDTLTSVENKTETLDSFPRIEDLRKSEREVKFNTQVDGTTQVESQTSMQDRTFTRKSDEKKIYFKKRLKIVTAVYTSVLALMLAFTIGNLATLNSLERTIKSNTEIIKSQNEVVKVLDESSKGQSIGEFTISLNEPRDYSEDKKELTWLDKVTILFRNIFG